MFWKDIHLGIMVTNKTIDSLELIRELKWQNWGFWKVSNICNDCNENYYSKNRRVIKTRYSENLAYIKYGSNERFILINHVLNSGNSLHKSLLKLVRHITDRRLLHGYERLKILQVDNLINNDRDPITINYLY